MLAPMRSRMQEAEPGFAERIGSPELARAGNGHSGMAETGEYWLQPELHMRDGRIIRTLGDAMKLLREHESRPGIDNRDEVLHGLERAQTDEQRQQAAAAFLAWARELDLVHRATKQRQQAPAKERRQGA
jgi:hypothetical protein